jgi:uncharacterized membrane protein
MTIARRFKGYFLHGLAVLLPSILTIWLFVWGYNFIQSNISRHINRGLVHLICLATYDRFEIKDAELKTYVQDKYKELRNNEDLTQIYMKRPDIRREFSIQELKKNLTKKWVDDYGSIVGFLIAVVSVCVIGALLASFVGKKLWQGTERFIMNTPLLKRVYPYIKQFTDFLLTQDDEQKKKFFSRVVAVEYPRQGIWTMGFVTGNGFEKVAGIVKEDFLTVFVPTAPAPFTGFIITIPKKLVIDLNITIEEAVRFIVSGGIVAPGRQTAQEGAPVLNAEGPVQENNLKFFEKIKES